MLVPDMIRKCVCFLGTKGSGEADFKPRATAFIASVFEAGFQFTYLITADHVVSNLIGLGHEIWLRINRKDGTIEETLLPSDCWFFSDEIKRTDIAAAPIQFDGSEDVVAIGLNNIFDLVVDQFVLDTKSIGVGEEIVIIGLFRSHYGKSKNIPIVRTGNIAAMPEEPVYTKEYGYIDAYLVEARSIGGLSGSPVFISMAPTRTVGGKMEVSSGPQFYLLGLVHGHFDIRDLSLDTVLDVGINGSINTGIGIVIPAPKILEMIMQSEQVETRLNEVKAYLAARGASPAV